MVECAQTWDRKDLEYDLPKMIDPASALRIPRLDITPETRTSPEELYTAGLRDLPRSHSFSFPRLYSLHMAHSTDLTLDRRPDIPSPDVPLRPCTWFLGMRRQSLRVQGSAIPGDSSTMAVEI